MIPTLYIPSQEVLAADLEAVEAELAGGLLDSARRQNLQPGDYFARRQRCLLRREILTWARERGARAYRIQAVPLTRSSALAEAVRAYSLQEAEHFLRLEARFEDELYTLTATRTAPGPGGVIAELEQDGVLTWLIGDPGPLFSAYGCEPGLAVGESRTLRVATLRPIACRYAVDPAERAWLEQRLGQRCGPVYSQYVELLPPDAYGARAAIARLVEQAHESGRIVSRALRPGVVFAALPGTLLDAVEGYFLGEQKLEGRELLKSLRGSEPDPLLQPLVDVLAAAELGEALPLGTTTHANTDGAVAVRGEAELVIEPEAQLFLESQLRDSSEVGEWLFGLSTFSGIFSGEGILGWREAQPLRKALEEREVWVVGLLDRHAFHTVLREKLFARGWKCVRRADPETWHAEVVHAWVDDAELRDWDFSIHPVRAYVEILFHGRDLETAVEARISLMQAELEQRRGSAPAAEASAQG